MDLCARRLVDDDICQKGNELRRGVPRRGFTQHLAGFGIERGVQRQCAMAIVLKAVPLRPGDSGNTGSLRSSAWIAVFSSTQNTAACAGGFTYSPMMSAALRSKSGSFEAM